MDIKSISSKLYEQITDLCGEVHIAIIKELAKKPDITLNEYNLEQYRRDCTWPTPWNLNWFHVENIIKYKEVELNIGYVGSMREIKVIFPNLVDYTTNNDARVTSTFATGSDTDAVYDNIVKAYARYKIKQQKLTQNQA